MLETIVVVAVVLAALAAGAFAWSYRRFSAIRARLIEHIRTAAQEMTVAGTTDVGLTVQVLGTEIDVDLATLARRRPPALAEPEWFERVIDGIRAQVPVPAAPPYPLVIDRLMPQLKPIDYVRIFERYPGPLRLAWRPFASGVAVTYVIAGGDRRTTVTSDMIQAWEISLDTLHAQAVDNLRKQTVHMLGELGGAQTRYEHLDGFDATRILVSDLIVPVEIADPLVAIPEETVLLIAPGADGKALAAEAAARHAASTRPVSSLLYRLSASGPVPAGPA